MKYLPLLLTSALALSLAACANDAQVASQNLSRDADNFHIKRRIVFYNGITDTYMLTIDGYCSQEQEGRKFTVTCKVAEGKFKKHFLYLSDNATYVSQQVDEAEVSTTRYGVTFKPSVLLPSIEAR